MLRVWLKQQVLQFSFSSRVALSRAQVGQMRAGKAGQGEGAISDQCWHYLT